ncbi:peptidyl-prolyl cis-trans isomerase ssp-1, partial [Aureobasidium melanogenum]
MATGLPSGWEVRHSNSKNLPYYFNPSTKESRWEPPSGTDSETLKHYMGTYHSSASLRPDGQGQQEGKIRASHLLVKHKDSRRPSSWREAQITRSKDEAMTIILGHEARIRSGATSLGDLATTESDCSSSRKRGDLGFFGKGDMQKEFEDAAFALKPGEVSHVVETASGLHLIERSTMPFAAQPRHRRPSWRQSRVSHRTYLETDFKRKQEHEMPADADSDTFYYNAAFVVEWLIPADLRLRLPESLVTELDDWQAAGAATKSSSLAYYV